jgi:hypothetical protein
MAKKTKRGRAPKKRSLFRELVSGVEAITITTQEQSPQFMKRTAAENRTMQFGFRVTF